MAVITSDTLPTIAWNKVELAKFFIYPTKDTVAENPRRENTAGYIAMELVISSPGMTVSEYLALDNTAMHHLKWDVAHGFIEITEHKRGGKVAADAAAPKAKRASKAAAAAEQAAA